MKEKESHDLDNIMKLQKNFLEKVKKERLIQEENKIPEKRKNQPLNGIKK